MPELAFCELGNQLTQALISGDFPLYRQVRSLPLRIVPRGGQAFVLANNLALAQDFALYHAAIRAAQVTDIYREVQEVRDESDGAFQVFCAVHIFVCAHRIADSDQSEITLMPTPHGLRISEIVSAAEHIDWTLGRGQIGPGAGPV